MKFKNWIIHCFKLIPNRVKEFQDAQDELFFNNFSYITLNDEEVDEAENFELSETEILSDLIF